MPAARAQSASRISSRRVGLDPRDRLADPPHLLRARRRRRGAPAGRNRQHGFGDAEGRVFAHRSARSGKHRERGKQARRRRQRRPVEGKARAAGRGRRDFAKQVLVEAQADAAIASAVLVAAAEAAARIAEHQRAGKHQRFAGLAAVAELAADHGGNGKTVISLAVNGTDAYRQAIEAVLAVTQLTADLIEATPYLELIRRPELSVVLFRRRLGPPRLRTLVGRAPRRTDRIRAAHDVGG